MTMSKNGVLKKILDSAPQWKWIRIPQIVEITQYMFKVNKKAITALNEFELEGNQNNFKLLLKCRL